MPFLADLGNLNFAKDLGLRSLAFLGAPQIFFLTLFILHVGHAVTLTTLEVLSQSFEFDGLGLIAVLQQSFCLFLSQSLLILHLEELFLLPAHSRVRLSQITPVLRDCAAHSGEGRSSRWWR